MTETSSNNLPPTGENGEFLPDEPRYTAQSLLEALAGDAQLAPGDFPERPRPQAGETRVVEKIVEVPSSDTPIQVEAKDIVWRKPEGVNDFNALSNSLLHWLVEEFSVEGTMLLDESGTIVSQDGRFRRNPELLASVPLLLRRSCFRTHDLLKVAPNGVKTIGIHLDNDDVVHVGYIPRSDKPLWLLAAGSSSTLPAFSKAAEYLLALD